MSTKFTRYRTNPGTPPVCKSKPLPPIPPWWPSACWWGPLFCKVSYSYTGHTPITKTYGLGPVSPSPMCMWEWYSPMPLPTIRTQLYTDTPNHAARIAVYVSTPAPVGNRTSPILPLPASYWGPLHCWTWTPAYPDELLDVQIGPYPALFA